MRRRELQKARKAVKSRQTVGAATSGLPMSYKLGPRWDDVITWSDFKSETIGFLSPNYTGYDT